MDHRIDPAAAAYSAIAMGFWSDYTTAESGGTQEDAAQACIREDNFKVCADRVKAMLPTLEKFLADINHATAPVRFATDDAAFKKQIPIAIADMKLILKAALAKDTAHFDTYVGTYMDDMVPTVTSALDDVDPSTVHH